MMPDWFLIQIQLEVVFKQRLCACEDKPEPLYLAWKSSTKFPDGSTIQI